MILWSIEKYISIKEFNFGKNLISLCPEIGKNTLFPMGLNKFEKIMKKVVKLKKMKLIQFSKKLQRELWIAIKVIQTRELLFKDVMFSLLTNNTRIKIHFILMKKIVYKNIFVSFSVLTIFPLKLFTLSYLIWGVNNFTNNLLAAFSNKSVLECSFPMLVFLFFDENKIEEKVGTIEYSNLSYIRNIT